MADYNKYDIEPYHPKIHRHILGANKGDHIIKEHHIRSTQQAKKSSECLLKFVITFHFYSL